MKKLHFREKGVVLLTCLVFLLVLLAMLRFTMTSARVEEQKAGIDLEIVSARESAQAALNFAEFYIRKQGELFCLSQGGQPADCAVERDLYTNLLLVIRDAELRNLNFGSDAELGNVPNLPDLVGSGYYSASFINASALNCDPFWACIDWDGNNADNGAATAVDRAGRAHIPANRLQMQSIECSVESCRTTGAINPRFIIERFEPQEIADGRSALSQSGQVIILRITAVGFGRGPANGNVTNSILQSSYILFNG